MRRFATRLDEHLIDRNWLVGDDYSVADIALYPMCALAWRDFPQWHDLAGVQRWMQRTAARPAVSEAMNWFRDRSPQFEREFV